MIRSVALEGDSLILSFPYDSAIVDAVREIPGRRWDPQRRVWSAPASSIRAVRAVASAHGLRLDDSTRRLPDRDPDLRPSVRMAAGRLTLSFPYDRDLVARIRDIPGARWSSASREWTVDEEAAVDVAEFVLATGAQIDDSARETLSDLVESIARLGASSAATAEIDIPRLSGTLLPFQRAGVAYVLSASTDGGVLLADQMGLGKTVQALASIAARDALPALIVCPASLRLNWQREATAWLPGMSVALLSGRTPALPDPWPDLAIINYDVLDAWADIVPAETRAVVLDESHAIKSGATIRTKAAIHLSDRLSPDALRLALTGTPVVNAPGELMTQLRFLRRLDDLGGPAAFRARYQGGQHLPELNRRLRASCMVRRRKDDVLADLPKKRWSEIRIEGDPETMVRYRAAERDVVAYLADRARDAALASGASSEEARRAAWEAAARASAAEHLVAVSALKRLAATAKVPAAIRWISDFIATGAKLVVFAHHREILDDIEERLSLPDLLRIDGETSQEDRHRAVRTFQETEASPVILCSLHAAGVGLTLTAASDVLFVEQAWTPAAMDQAADRCHRIGQTDSVTAWVLTVSDSIDEAIAEIIAGKRQIVDAATDGDDPDGALGGSILSDLVVRLTERGLSDAEPRAPDPHPRPASRADLT